MKKVLMIALSLVCVVFMCACAKQAEKEPAPTQSAQGAFIATNAPKPTFSGEQSAQGVETDMVDRTSIEGYLAEFTLTDEFLRLPTFTRFDTDTNVDTGEVTGINVYQSEVPDAAGKQAWVESVYSKLTELAGGSVITDDLTQKAMTVEDVDYTAAFIIKSGYFAYNGKEVSFIFAVMNGIDNADVNEASAGASFAIEWR